MATYRINGNTVSKPWHAVLTAARKDISFSVTDGRRSMALQAVRYATYLRNGHPLAARPSPGAPHINYGRANHAIDVNALDGGAERLVSWLRRKGIRSASRPVPGEPWHIQVSRSELLALVERLDRGGDDPIIRPYFLKPFRANDREAVVSLQKLLRGLHYTKVVNGKYGVWTRKAVRKFQKRHNLRVDGVVGSSTWKALRGASDK